MTDEAPAQPPLTPIQRSENLPFSKWWPVVAGALVGVVLRLAFFGVAGGPLNAMMGAFIYLAPFAVGAVTVYLAERQARRTWGYYIIASMGATALFVVGTLLIMIEGWICVIVIMPMFTIIGMVGGLIMGAVCRWTQWPKHTTYGIAVLPLVLGVIEPTANLPTRVKTIERTVSIQAPREVVWRQLMNVPNIRREEVDEGLAFRIGVPPPLSAMSGDDAGRHVRRITMGKRVHFDQVELERREGEYVRWAQRFYPDSFPPGSFDEHVVMGGDYFDMESVAYELTPNGQATTLKVSMRYRVSTRFNWYADPVARLMIGNLEEVLLRLYQERSQANAAA